jgi:hypothetical protein
MLTVDNAGPNLSVLAQAVRDGAAPIAGEAPE